MIQTVELRMEELTRAFNPAKAKRVCDDIRTECGRRGLVCAETFDHRTLETVLVITGHAAQSALPEITKLLPERT